MNAVTNKIKFKLGILHKVAIAVLLGLGILFFLNYDIYRLKVEYNPQQVYIPFLKAGDYEIDILYEYASEGNFVIVSSGFVTDTNNNMGVVFAQREMETGPERRMILNIHLDQGTYGLLIQPQQQEQCFQEVKVQRVQLLDKDNYFLCGLCLLAVVCIAMLGWFVPVEKYRDIMILIGISLAASLPLFSDFLLDGDDLRFHLARLEGLYQGLRSGVFPVRINPQQTELFGNVTATMYPQLFLYPAVLPRFLDISVMTCYKLLLVCINIGAAVFTFYAVKRICGSVKMAYIASVLYTFSLYRIIDVYYRAALGEALAMTFFPLILWGMWEILWGEKKRWHILTIGMTCVMQSHIISVELAVLFLALEAVLWLITGAKGDMLKRIAAGIKATAATCLLNLGLIVPFLFFSGENFVVFSIDYYVADFKLYFSQMFSLFPPAIGESLEMGTTQGEMPLTVGGILLVGAILFCVSLLREKKLSNVSLVGLHCLGFGILSLIMTSWLFPWERIGETEFLRKLVTPLQYCWRLLGPASLFLCVVSAVGIVMFITQSSGRNWVCGVFLTVALSSAWFLFDSMAVERGSINDEMFLEGNTEYDSLYMYNDGDQPPEFELQFGIAENYIKTLHDTKVVYSEYQKTGTSISVYVDPVEKPKEEEYLLFPLYYYPGYEILVNGEKVEVVSPNRFRLVACRLPEEEAYIQVAYKGMPLWRAADIVSWLTAIGIIAYAVSLSLMRKKGKSDR